MCKIYQFHDLKVGMDVRAEELANIYDTFIVLDNAKTIGDNGSYSTEGKILFIGRSLDESYDKINKKGKRRRSVRKRKRSVRKRKSEGSRRLKKSKERRKSSGCWKSSRQLWRPETA